MACIGSNCSKSELIRSESKGISLMIDDCSTYKQNIFSDSQGQYEAKSSQFPIPKNQEQFDETTCNITRLNCQYTIWWFQQRYLEVNAKLCTDGNREVSKIRWCIMMITTSKNIYLWAAPRTLDVSFRKRFS